jgi:hypothetical protein
VAEKKNPDYTASAVNLTNRPELARLTAELQELQQSVEVRRSLLADIQEYKDLQEGEAAVNNKITEIRQAIDIYGSYQDHATGRYALKQRKQTREWHADNFESYFSEYAAAALTKSVNVPVVEGLLKGGLLFMDELEKASIITYKETFSYIIK